MRLTLARLPLHRPIGREVTPSDALKGARRCNRIGFHASWHRARGKAARATHCSTHVVREVAEPLADYPFRLAAAAAVSGTTTAPVPAKEQRESRPRGGWASRALQ
jgi:hypothetical protein